MTRLRPPLQCRKRKSQRGGFPCPACGRTASVVALHSDGFNDSKERKHVCGSCGERFTTLQTYISSPIGGPRYQAKAGGSTSR